MMQGCMRELWMTLAMLGQCGELCMLTDEAGRCCRYPVLAQSCKLTRRQQCSSYNQLSSCG
jgi:hypothetical protein